MKAITTTRNRNIRSVNLGDLIQTHIQATAVVASKQVDIHISFEKQTITIEVLLERMQIYITALTPTLPAIPIPISNPKATSLLEALGKVGIGGDVHACVQRSDANLVNPHKKSVRNVNLGNLIQLNAAVEAEIEALLEVLSVELKIFLENGIVGIDALLNGNTLFSQSFPLELPFIPFRAEELEVIQNEPSKFDANIHTYLVLCA